jgi:integrase
MLASVPEPASLEAHKAIRDRERSAAGRSWQETNLVFCHEDGSMYTSGALNGRFSKMTRKVGIGHWHAHEDATPQCRS